MQFWKDSAGPLIAYLQRMGHRISLFDAPLVYKFSRLSSTRGGDMRRVFDDTLVKYRPAHAVVRLAGLVASSHTARLTRVRRL